MTSPPGRPSFPRVDPDNRGTNTAARASLTSRRRWLLVIKVTKVGECKSGHDKLRGSAVLSVSSYRNT
jgi:hypothetical protein